MKLVTLIPAFKVQYFESLLNSLAMQTVKPEKILVSDDSAGDDFLDACGSRFYQKLTQRLNIDCKVGPKQGQYANIQSLIEELTPDVTHFHVLCDDDIIYPAFYQKHLAAQRAASTLASFSKRRIVDSNGESLEAPEYPRELVSVGDSIALVDAEYLFKTTLPTCHNWLGEFSNTVFTTAARQLFLDPRFNGIVHYGLYDLGIFLRSALANDVIFINEYQGAFRRSPEQHSSQTKGPVFRSSILAWLALAVGSYQAERITEIELLRCAQTVFSLLGIFFPDDKQAGKVLALKDSLSQRHVQVFCEEFLELWPMFLQHLAPQKRRARPVK